MKSRKETHEPPTADFKHIPALDGIRGIAVLAVLVYHGRYAVPALAPLTKNLYLGVDVFFVLSGFLITSILLKERSQTGTISLKNFYVRRFLRLVPAYWAFLIFVYFLGSTFSSEAQSALLYNDWNFTAAFLYLSNWQHVVAYPNIPGALIHLWSLAVEEQFYIAFSLLMWIFIKFKATRRQMLCTLGGFILIAAATRAFRLANGMPLSTVITSTETRIDGLLIGVLAGMIFMWKILPAPFYRSRRFKALAALSLIVIGAIFALAVKSIFFYGTLMPVFSLAVAVLLLYLAAGARTYAHGLLEFAPLQFTGRISYGLYMWNIIGFIIASNLFASGIGIFLFGAALSFGFALISYYKIEEPFLKLKSRFA